MDEYSISCVCVCDGESESEGESLCAGMRGMGGLRLGL